MALGVDLGTYYVSVAPSARDFGSQLRNQITRQMAPVGRDMSRQINDAMADGVGDGVTSGARSSKTRTALDRMGSAARARLSEGVKGGVEDGLKDAPKEAQRKGRESGEKFSGEFDKVVRNRVKKSLDALPAADVEIDNAEAKQKIEAIRALLNTLKDQRIGVDVSAADARAQIAVLERELNSIGDVDINVDADVGAALLQIRAASTAIKNMSRDSGFFGRAMGTASGQARGLGSFLDRSSLSMGQMIVLAGTLGTALIPVAGAAAGVAASLAAPLAAGGAGLLTVGASLTGNITQILKAQKDLETLQKTAATAAQSYASAQSSVRTAMEGLKSAQRGVVSAQVNANRSIESSVQALADARVNANRSISTSEMTLKSTIQSSHQSIISAEGGLASAQDQARASQEALNDAREEARRNLASLRLELRGAALDESGARLAVRQARKALSETMSDPKSTQLDIDLARQALKESKLSYREAQKNRQQTQKDAREDRRQGIKGDESVRDAKDSLAEANQGVRDAEKELARTRVQAAQDIAQARKAVAQARVDAARDIAQAEKAVEQARIDGAQAVAEAQRGVTSAARGVKDAQAAAAIAGAALATAQGDVRDAMAKTKGPAAVFIKAMDGAKGAWQDFLDRTKGPSLGLATDALDTFSDLMPKLAPLSNKAANAVGGLLGEFRGWVNGGGADKTIDWLERWTGPSITKIGHILGNATIGVAGFFKAFNPLGQDVLSGMEDLSAKFRKFGEGADKNPAVQDFIAYVRDVGPDVVDTLGALARAVAHIVRAGAPIGKVVLKGVEGLATALAKIPVPALTVAWAGLAGAFLSFKVAALGSSIATKALEGRLFTMFNLKFTAAAIGIGLIVDALHRLDGSSSGAETAIGVLETTVGGAMAGFAVGGPWGAAIGAGAGALAGLYQKVRGAKPVFHSLDERLADSGGAYARFKNRTKDASSEVSTLTDMLNQNTGALSKNAKQAVLKDFVDEGGLAAAKDAQVPLALIEKALYGNEKALRKIKSLGSSDFVTSNLQAEGLEKVYQLLNLNQDQIKAAQQNVRDTNKLAEATKAYNNIVKKVPESVVTKLSLADDKKVARLIKGIQKKYDLTPKEVRTLLVAADKTKPEVSKAEKRLSFVSRARKAFIDAKMRNYDLTRKQAIDLWEKAPKDRKSLINYQSKGWKKAMADAEALGKKLSSAVTDWASVFSSGKASGRDLGKGIGKMPWAASGGLITGPGTGTSDSIAARLSNGEFVVNAASTRRNLGLLHALNSNRFADGGLVGSSLGSNLQPTTGGGFRTLWRREIKPELDRLIRALRGDGGSKYGGGNYNYGGNDGGNNRLPKGMPSKPHGKLKGFTNNPRLNGFSGVDKDSSKKQPWKVGGDLSQWSTKEFSKSGGAFKKTLDGTIRPTLKRWRGEVNKTLDNNDRRLKRFTKRTMSGFDKSWDSTFRKRIPGFTKRMDDQVKKNLDKTGKGLGRFTSGPLARFEDNFDKTATDRIPADAKTMDTRVRATATKTGNGLKSFGNVVKDKVAPAFAAGVDNVGKAWSKVQGASGKPVKFVIKTVLNDGLIKGFNKIAAFVDTDKMDKLDVPKGFRTGGYTGNRPVNAIAGVVHGDEHVIRAESRRKIESTAPGALDYMNNTGRLPGYKKGGKVTTGYRAPVAYNHPYPWDADDAARAGVDWAYDIPVNTVPVSAAWSGRVSTVADEGNTSYGKWIELAHPGGFSTIYAHLSRQMARLGQMVSAGTQIGISGNTGGVSGAGGGYHLHFEGDNGAPPIGSPSGKGPIGGPGMGPVLPGWAQKIMDAPKKWAANLLDGGDNLKGFGLGKNSQSMLNKLVGPSAKWAKNALGSFGTSAGNFGPGAAGVWKSLMSTGWYSPQQAAGVMGNMQSESGFNPHIVQGGGSAALPTGIDSGWGLVQWTPGHKILPYLNGDGSIGSQVNALTAQLQGKGPLPESSAGAFLKATRTPERAAYQFGDKYERYDGDTQTNRETQARAIFEKFKGTHDKGGLFPAKSFAFNGTSGTEAVFTQRQWGVLDKFIPDPSMAGAGGRSFALKGARVGYHESLGLFVDGRVDEVIDERAAYENTRRRRG